MGSVESFIIPIGVVICKTIAGNLYKPLNFLLFMFMVSIYTMLIMFYRCRIKSPETPSPKDDKIKDRPYPEYSKFWLALIPLLIWGVIGLSLPYIKSKLPPQILLILLLVTNSIGLYIVSFLAYNASLKYTVIPQCYPSSILDKIFGFFGKILGFIF